MNFPAFGFPCHSAGALGWKDLDSKLIIFGAPSFRNIPSCDPEKELNMSDMCFPSFGFLPFPTWNPLRFGPGLRPQSLYVCSRRALARGPLYNCNSIGQSTNRNAQLCEAVCNNAFHPDCCEVEVVARIAMPS